MISLQKIWHTRKRPVRCAKKIGPAALSLTTPGPSVCWVQAAASFWWDFFLCSINCAHPPKNLPLPFCTQQRLHNNHRHSLELKATRRSALLFALPFTAGRLSSTRPGSVRRHVQKRKGRDSEFGKYEKSRCFLFLLLLLLNDGYRFYDAEPFYDGETLYDGDQ